MLDTDKMVYRAALALSFVIAVYFFSKRATVGLLLMILFVAPSAIRALFKFSLCLRFFHYLTPYQNPPRNLTRGDNDERRRVSTRINYAAGFGIRFIFTFVICLRSRVV